MSDGVCCPVGFGLLANEFNQVSMKGKIRKEMEIGDIESSPPHPEMQTEWDADKWQTVAFNQLRSDKDVKVDIELSDSWRMKDRMKTVSVALVMCLNVGVDPPDVIKPAPCARLECWLDPLAMSQQKALEMIGNSLQKQFERWQPRARYKLSLDPTVEDVKKLCQSLRLYNILFHLYYFLFTFCIVLGEMLRTNEYYFTIMAMECLNQLKMGKFGSLTKLIRNIFH